MYEVLSRIHGPEDVKSLDGEELVRLAADIRDALMNRISKAGGHFGPNFGVVEATIALHYVFDSPKDKFVFDVSHQSYPHKILTGRAEAYTNPERFRDVSGYTNPEESEHDFFNVGHTSTSIALASGLAEGRNLLGGHENIIALIGDGALSGGEALEALDYAGSELKGNFIIVVNDNQQAIAEVHGGLYENLKLLRETDGQAENNLFRAMGLDYVYEAEGNDVLRLIDVFGKVKDIDHPIVVHINTVKGKGYGIAEKNKEAWHYTAPFDPDTGRPAISFGDTERYTDLTAAYLMDKAKKDSSFIVVTPAMPGAAGLTPQMREELGIQYRDVGIAEEQAVAMASGIAKNGGKPVVITAATFMQRAFDQISQDVCINNTPVTIVLNYASVMAMNDVTHLGIYAISAFSNIPNLVVLAPTSGREYRAMLSWAVDQKDHPVMILMPHGRVTDDERTVDGDYSDLNRFKVEQRGSKVAILALGDFYGIGKKVAEAYERRTGIQPTLINPRFASGIDAELLEGLKADHDRIVTLEDGILDGGFGQKISAFYADSDMKVISYGMEKEFYDRYDSRRLLKDLGIDPEIIAETL